MDVSPHGGLFRYDFTSIMLTQKYVCKHCGSSEQEKGKAVMVGLNWNITL